MGTLLFIWKNVLEKKQKYFLSGDFFGYKIFFKVQVR